MSAKISKETAQQVVFEYMKKTKNTDKVDVSIIEQKRGDWVVRGTCPINMEGHPWAEKFEVVIDAKGKVKSLDCGLL